MTTLTYDANDPLTMIEAMTQLDLDLWLWRVANPMPRELITRFAKLVPKPLNWETVVPEQYMPVLGIDYETARLLHAHVKLSLARKHWNI